MPLVLVLFDSLVNINRSYFKDGELVIKRKQIFFNYLKQGFFTDFATIIGMILSEEYK